MEGGRELGLDPSLVWHPWQERVWSYFDLNIRMCEMMAINSISILLSVLKLLLVELV